MQLTNDENNGYLNGNGWWFKNTNTLELQKDLDKNDEDFERRDKDVRTSFVLLKYYWEKEEK